MFLITGATGNVGREITKILLNEGTPFRVFTRNPDSLRNLLPSDNIATGSYADPDSFRRALQGVEAVYLMSPRAGADISDEITNRIANAANVRVVFQSSLLAATPESEIGQMHKNTEDKITNAGLEGVFLRPSGFMSNALQWVRTIQTQATVYNPMGAGQIAPIAPEDIAAVTVKALHNAPEARGVLPLSGDEVFTVADQVRILSEVLGVPIRCVEISTEAAAQNMISAGIPPEIAALVARSFELVRQGYGSKHYDTVQRVTGRPALTFREWVRAHQGVFVPAQQAVS